MADAVYTGDKMSASPDEIADCVLSAFDALPAKRKPREREDGTREWIPLSGIVLQKGTKKHPACKHHS